MWKYEVTKYNAGVPLLELHLNEKFKDKEIISITFRRIPATYGYDEHYVIITRTKI